MPEINAEELEQIIQSAKEEFQDGRYNKAIQGFNSARKIFLENEDPVNAAEMANNLSVAYLQDKQSKKALEIVLGTEVIFEQAGEIQKQAVALGNIGAALEAQKDLEGAADAYQRSADLFQGIGEKEMRSMVLKSLSAIHIRQGKQIESIFAMQQSLEGKPNRSLRERFLQWFLKVPFRFLKK